MFGLIGEQLFRSGLLVMGAALAVYLCFMGGSAVFGKKLKAILEREYGKKRH